MRVSCAGRAALAALQSGPATVFASFERSCYVETPSGIACLGVDIGLGPLNAIVEGFAVPSIGSVVAPEFAFASVWIPPKAKAIEFEIPSAVQEHSRFFLKYRPEELVGLGPGLTPAGDDYLGGQMIALRAFGRADEAERMAAWVLPLARERTSRISRAHLECAAAGEGHEALHELLANLGDVQAVERSLERLSRIGHSSGMDAAAGALLALR